MAFVASWKMKRDFSPQSHMPNLYVLAADVKKLGVSGASQLTFSTIQLVPVNRNVSLVWQGRGWLVAGWLARQLAKAFGRFRARFLHITFCCDNCMKNGRAMSKVPPALHSILHGYAATNECEASLPNHRV